MTATSPTSTTRYHEVARILHWLIAGLILLQYALANMAEDAVSDLQVEMPFAKLAYGNKRTIFCCHFGGTGTDPFAMHTLT